MTVTFSKTESTELTKKEGLKKDGKKNTKTVLVENKDGESPKKEKMENSPDKKITTEEIGEGQKDVSDTRKIKKKRKKLSKKKRKKEEAQIKKKRLASLYKTETYDPCVHLHFKPEHIDRDCLTRDQYLEMLATPRGYRWIGEVDCNNPELPINKQRRKRAKRKQMHFVQAQAGDGEEEVETMWDVVTPEITGRLIDFLVNEFGMSLEEAEDFIGCVQQTCFVKQHVPKKKKIKQKTLKYKWAKEYSQVFSTNIQQYLNVMLTKKRTQRVRKIAEVIVERLCDLTGENISMDKPKKKSHKIIVHIADRLALWIDDIYKAERKKKVQEEEIPESELEEEEEEEEEEDGDLKKKSEEKEKAKEEKPKDEEEGEEEEEEEGEEEEEKEPEKEEEQEKEKEPEQEKEESEKKEEKEPEKEEEKEEEKEPEKEKEKEPEKEEKPEEKEEKEPEKEEEEEEPKAKEEEKEEEKEEKPKEDEEAPGEEKPEEGEEEAEEGQEEAEEGEDGDEEGEGEEEEGEEGEEEAEEEAEEGPAEEEGIEEEEKEEEKPEIKPPEEEKRRPLIPPRKTPGFAFEVKPKTGSTLQVQKLSSGTVAEVTAKVRGVEAPPRGRKVPVSESPLNLKSAEDWADWADNIANIADEWGKWLENRLTDAEKQLLEKRKSKSDWKSWRDQAQTEALKWRVEEERIKDEAEMWGRKIDEKLKNKSETEIKTTDL